MFLQTFNSILQLFNLINKDPVIFEINIQKLCFDFLWSFAFI